jgi:hypothetical protein
VELIPVEIGCAPQPDFAHVLAADFAVQVKLVKHAFEAGHARHVFIAVFFPHLQELLFRVGETGALGREAIVLYHFHHAIVDVTTAGFTGVIDHRLREFAGVMPLHVLRQLLVTARA